MKIIKRFISQVCIGYSADYSTSYFECRAETNEEKEITCWVSSTTLPSGIELSSPVSFTRPRVAIPAIKES